MHVISTLCTDFHTQKYIMLKYNPQKLSWKTHNEDESMHSNYTYQVDERNHIHKNSQEEHTQTPSTLS